jgi:ferritin-like protein
MIPAAMDQSRNCDGVSRRLLLRGAGAAAAGSIAACGKDDQTTTQSGGIEGTESDVGTLRGALAIELTAITAYERGLPLLAGARRRASELFLAQEQEHADALTKAITQLGGNATAEIIPLDYRRLSGPRFLDLATRVADAGIGVYLDAVPRLSSGDLRATVATMLTDEAEHLSVLLGFLGRPQAPNALVSGDPHALR